MFSNFKFIAATASLVLLFFIAPATAADAARTTAPAKAAGATKTIEAPTPPADYLGRDTPFGTVNGFIQAMRVGDPRRGANYLEGSETAQQKEELAGLLQIVLNRGAKLRLRDLSRQPEGDLADGLPPNVEQVGVAKLADRDLGIMLHRQMEPGATPVWLFSAQTLRRVPEAAEELKPRLGERLWPESFAEHQYLSIPLYAWLNSLLLVPGGLVIAWLASRGLRVVLRAALRQWFIDQSEAAANRLRDPIFLLVFAILMRIIGSQASTVSHRLFWSSVGTVLIITAFSWLAVRVTSLAVGLRVRYLHEIGKPGRIAMSELISWGLTFLIIVAGLFLALRSLNIDVSTAVAGLGVGGIAVAFAAQKTIADLFGTITVVGDEAIRIGDECRIGTLHGRVEEVGLRSTRIRSVDRSLFSIPNGQLASMSIENLQLRDKFRFHHTIRLSDGTTADQLRQVLTQVRQLMAGHPDVEGGTVRAWLTGFGESSVDITVRVHVLTRDEEIFLRIQEELLLGITEIVEANGTSMALPSRVLYHSDDAAANRAEPAHRQGTGPGP
jgi:MscS family membrane protein